jgi:hypothetical protein
LKIWWKRANNCIIVGDPIIKKGGTDYINNTELDCDEAEGIDNGDEDIMMKIVSLQNFDGLYIKFNVS